MAIVTKPPFKRVNHTRAQVALLASALAHALILGLFLVRGGSIAEGHVGAGGRGDQAERGEQSQSGSIVLSLINATAIQRARSTPSQTTTVIQDPLAALMAKATPSERAGNKTFKPSNPSASLDALMGAADTTVKTQGKQSAASSAAGAGGSPASGSAGLSGDLFSQVEPCWKRALGESGVPVALEFALDRAGRVAGAPHVTSVGDATSSDERRVAVERALQAVAACLPFKPSGGANPSGTYTIRFGISKGR